MTDYWTMPEINRLRELYQTTPAHQLAEHLGKNITAIRSMIKRLRLTKRRDWNAIAAKHRPIVFAVRIGGPRG